MSLLESIHQGRRFMPPRLMLYGTEGVGKSTMAAGAHGAVFVPTEDGLGQIDCHSLPLCKRLEDVTAALDALATEKHGYETVVLDSLDWMERLIHDKVCEQFGVTSIEKADGGYQRGYVHALTHWRKALEQLEALRAERGMMVVLVAHAKVEKFDDPETSAYDRYSPRLHKHATALVTEWADAVLFCTRRIATKTEDAGFGQKRTIAAGVGPDGGERIIRTVGGPACVAKNRYGLPCELPLSWEVLFGAILASQSPNDTQTEGESSHA